jgi:hypothetical protein
MTYTTTMIREKKERNMYGITEEKLNEFIALNTFEGDSGLMLACGMMSDCQEILEGLDDGDVMDREQIRKILNRAKYIVFKFMEDRNIR